jgi:hypothetical protein
VEGETSDAGLLDEFSAFLGEGGMMPVCEASGSLVRGDTILDVIKRVVV